MINNSVNSSLKRKFYKDDYKRFNVCANFMWLIARKRNPEIIEWVQKNLTFLDKTQEQKFNSIFQYQKDSKLNSGLELRAAGGILFESNLAKHFQKKYKEAFFDFETIPNWKKMDSETKFKITKKIIDENKYEVLYQPYFVLKNTFVTKCDFLFKTDIKNVFKLYEVKAINNIDTKAKKDELQYDLEYQSWILKELGYQINEAAIIKFNPDYILYDQVDWDDIWTKSLLFDTNFTKKANLTKRMEDAFNYLHLPKVSIEKKILEKQECFEETCYHIIHKPSSKYNWLNIYRLTRKKKVEFYKANNNKEIDLQAITIDDFNLSEVQKRSVEVVQELGNIIKDKNITRELIRLYSYPLYFYDFESCQFPIPAFKNSSPWNQIPFQYSIHVLTDRNYHLKTKKNIHHLDFISIDSKDPRIGLTKQLVEDMEKFGRGTYVSYNKSFEIGILKNIIKNIPLTEIEKEKLEYIIKHTVDLMDFFKKFNIYHPDFYGSMSIKKTYQALVPEQGGYQDLSIKAGDKASALYFNHITKRISEKEWQKDVQDLKKYCATDTWAMVELFYQICQLVKR